MSSSKKNHILSQEGIVSWQSPSNIAIIKYWGKRELQIPENPSFSLTLNHARTNIQASYQLGDRFSERKIEVFLDEVLQPSFVPKIEQLLARIENEYPVLKSIQLTLRTHNTFPHSSGIASSASAMSAIACCLGEILGISDDLEELSRISRLGSGSACRSLFPHGALWGNCKELNQASNAFAIPMSDQMHPVFKTFRDSILIVKSGEKSVSSTAGHNLMKTHPFAHSRYANAKTRMGELLLALKSGDVENFGIICEQEALELHALMMCSTPPYILIEPNTLKIIQCIQEFRKKTHIPAYFTLDAGPNIHLLHPASNAIQVKKFIETELVPFCENRFWINDEVGLGSKKIDHV